MNTKYVAALLFASLFSLSMLNSVTAQAQQTPPNDRGSGNFGPRAPEPTPEFVELKAVPHGDLHVVWYDSKEYGVQRRMHIYTPPGYERSKKYPVLYLIHGGGQDDAAWSSNGRVGFMLDNLLADGKVKPMIVVMPNGGGAGMGQNRPWNPNSTESFRGAARLFCQNP